MKRSLPKMTVGIYLILILIVLAFLSACGGPAPTPVEVPVEVTKIVEVEKEVEVVVTKEVEKVVEKVVEVTSVPEEAPAAPAGECPETIKIGAVIDVTGPLAAFGAEFSWAFDYAVEVLNADGGVLVEECGKKIPIEILLGDHAADEQKAVTEMEYLVEQGVHIFTGSTAVMPLGQVVAEKNGIPFVCAQGNLVGPFSQGMRYVFTTNWMTSETAMWPFLLSEDFDPNWTPVFGFMEEQNLMGIDYGTYFRQECVTRQANCVFQGYQRFAGDFSTQILAFKDAGVDFVYAPMIGPDGMKFWAQMQELDFVPKADLQFVAPADRRSWVTLPNFNYVITSNDYHWATDYAGAAEFDTAYAADHDGERATELAGDGYAVIQILVDAIERAGTLDPVALRDAVAATNMETIKGPIAFNPNGTPIREYFAVQYIDGVETIIWPKEMAERDPVFPFPAWTDPNR